MRKLYTLVILFFCLTAFTQTKNYYWNSWRLGLNMGGMWQNSDLNKNAAGFAGGFTLEKGIFENKSHFFSLAIRGRGLFGNTYGNSSKKNYAITGNPSLDGTYNKDVNYNDTLGFGTQKRFVYNNYKTQISEGALELQISFNELRERTHIILNLWGGVGFSVYRVNTNLLDADGKTYNFFKVDSTGSTGSIVRSQRNLMDRSYESYGQGSKAGDLFTFSPSAGIGLGYQFSKNFSILFEYKVTFPQGINADLLDGYTGINNHWAGKNNDFYHYTAVNFLFTLGRGGRTHDTTHHINNTANNYPPAHTNTIAANNNNQPPINNGNQVGVVEGIHNNAVNKPVVNITNPGYSPSVAYGPVFTVQAKVYNVTARNQININFNGGTITNYAFSGNDISFQVNLIPGVNNVIITASNQAGSDSKSATINYQGAPPAIVISNPSSNPFNTTNPSVNINAAIANIISSGDIEVKFNGAPVSYFSYDAQSTQFSLPLNLNQGNNNFEIIASNAFGKDAKYLTLVYSKQVNISSVVVGKPLGLVIQDPVASPKTIKSAFYFVKAKADGVTSYTQVAVMVNGNSTNFNFDPNSGMVTFNAPLNLGSNNISVTAKNGKSSTSRSTSIIYEEDRIIAPPQVTMTSPVSSPYTNKTNSFIFKAQTKNINSNAQLEVKFNGAPTVAYNFNSMNGTIEFNTGLTPNANNIFEVKATNIDGIANASAIVIYNESTGTNISLTPKVICFAADKINYKTITIFESEWPAYKAKGAYEGPCKETNNGEGNLDPQITICHKGENNSKQTITILQSQWPAHMAHGDVMGACPKVIEGEGGNFDPPKTICHKNEDGSKQTIVILQSQWASHLAHGDAEGTCPKLTEEGGGNIDPQITICHKVDDRFSQTMTILQSQWAVHQAHGDQMGACPANTVAPEQTALQICHNNGDGSTITMTIMPQIWAIHQAHGDVMGTCTTATVASDPDIQICHFQGTNLPAQNMTIKQSQWSAHQAHGDHLGNCSNKEENPDLVICHIPPGNNQNPQTITISYNAWPAHLAHGDTMGPCPEGKTIKGGGGTETEMPKKNENQNKGDNGQSAPRTVQPEPNKDGNLNKGDTQSAPRTIKTETEQPKQETIEGGTGRTIKPR